MTGQPIHPLLARQLKRCFGSIEQAPPAVHALIDVVNEAYHQADLDRRMLERSLELSSEELGAANRGLSEALGSLRDAHRDMEQRVADRTRELAAANEHLRHAQKMEAVGTLAGGIAHDFNNLLMVIDGSTHLLLAGARHDDPARSDLGEIRRATDRAAELTRQLLAFSRRQVMTPRTVDLNTVVLDMQRMLSRVVREDIALIAEAAPAPAWVELDPNQIEQVLLNLVLNSRDALPDGGEIRIAVALETPSANAPLGSVRLTVTDNGTGMPPEVKSRVFEPFFSTKDGRGTGLGLASVHGIVHQSNGVISVESTPGVGTTFTMRFPAVPAGVRSEVPSDRVPVVEKTADVVLLVEDEDPVRRVFSKLLRVLGYDVIEASTPAEACEVFETQKARIDVLVTDIIMPTMNGPTLAKRFLAERPGLPVLFVSGHSHDEASLMDLDRPGIGFLPKPARLPQLAAKLNELLAVARQGA
jgi:signal transduction histidine kinase/CheY-like chemotaxis protein